MTRRYQCGAVCYARAVLTSNVRARTQLDSDDLAPFRRAEVISTDGAAAAVADVRGSSRFRLLDLRCRAGHRLARVYGTAIGPVLTGETTARSPSGNWRAAGGLVAVGLRELHPDQRIGLTCRCRHVSLSAHHVMAHLATKAASAVVGSEQ